jgi:hypothetical protein
MSENRIITSSAFAASSFAAMEALDAAKFTTPIPLAFFTMAFCRSLKVKL